MISLSDRQLQIVQQAAAPIDQGKRSTFLLRVGAMLEMRGRFPAHCRDDRATKWFRQAA